MQLRVEYLHNMQRGRGKFYLVAMEEKPGPMVMFNWGPCGAVGQAQLQMSISATSAAHDKIRSKSGRGYLPIISTTVTVDLDRADAAADPAALAAAVHAALRERGRAAASRAARGQRRDLIVADLQDTTRGPWQAGVWQGLQDAGAVRATDVAAGVGWVRAHPSAHLTAGLRVAPLDEDPALRSMGDEQRHEVLSAAAALGDDGGTWSERMQVGLALAG